VEPHPQILLKTHFIVSFLALLLLAGIFAPWSVFFARSWVMLVTLVTLVALALLAWFSVPRRWSKRLLGNCWGSAVCCILVVLELAILSSFGCVRVTNLQLPGDQELVWIYPRGGAKGEARHLGSKATLIVPCHTGLFSSSPYVVKFSGFPGKEVQVGAWHVEPIQVPHDLLRPVVLIAFDETLVLLAVRSPDPTLQLRVQIDGQEYRIPFTGNSVLVGCENDLELPSHILRQLGQSAEEEVRSRLTGPASLPGGPLLNPQGGTVRAEVFWGGAVFHQPNRYTTHGPTATRNSSSSLW